MDVGDWLRNLGLGQYEAAFIENDIDTGVLPKLTEGDLEKLGISLGHRKRLITAIEALARGSRSALITSEVRENAPRAAAETPTNWRRFSFPIPPASSCHPAVRSCPY